MRPQSAQTMDEEGRGSASILRTSGWDNFLRFWANIFYGWLFTVIQKI